MTDQVQRPLSGIRVVGIEQYIAGPYCTMLLGDSGAEVIKVERPGSGDPRRGIPPFAEKEGVKRAVGFMAYNRNKKSLAVDLKTEEGRAIVRRLAQVSDVVVENLRPGALSRLDLGFDRLKTANPRLVYAVISGFGRLPGYESPYSHRPAFDLVAEAMAGVMNLIGFEDRPPTSTLYGLADLWSGMAGALGIVQALLMRERTGEGQLVDVSLLDSMLALNEGMVAQYSVTGREPVRGRSDHVWPRGAFPCSDGYVALNVPDDATWARFAKALGRTDLIRDPRTATGTARASNQEFLRPIIESWMAGKTRSQVVETLDAHGMPAGPVYSASDVFADPHFEARGMLPRVHDPQVGSYRFARTPPHLSAAPEIPLSPAPVLGAHTREILEDLLGYESSRVDALAGAGIIGL